MSKTEHPSETFLSARLWPHRSLSTGGYRILMFLIAGILFCISLVFLSLGAWPVVGFLGLDLFLIWLAFHMNFIHARAHETITVTRAHIDVEKVNHKGQSQHLRFIPFWTRLHVRDDKEEGIQVITLTSKGQSTRIGDCLNPEDRKSFVQQLKKALNQACRF
jgi:uncharacterized membrane protein